MRYTFDKFNVVCSAEGHLFLTSHASVPAAHEWGLLEMRYTFDKFNEVCSAEGHLFLISNYAGSQLMLERCERGTVEVCRIQQATFIQQRHTAAWCCNLTL